MPIQEKLQGPGPKKLLALDGGGIRGLITIEVLAAIEDRLRDRLGRGSEFVLADYFDYVAGTSTGAIIATCISLGMSMPTIRGFYLEHGAAMFDRASLLERFRYKYCDEKLASMLREVIRERARGVAPGAVGIASDGEPSFGSPALRTLLLVVLRNASTDSPWPLSNNPRALFNDPGLTDCNLRLPLWQIVRASTAAPTYFPPELVRIGEKEFIFVDGGVTTYNNPAFQLFLMATLEPYRLEWKAGADQMLLVSVGTGASPKANQDLQPSEMNLLYNAASIPSALMYAAANEQDLLCRSFGDCVAGDPLDCEVGDLIGARGPLDAKLFRYARYNAELSEKGLNALGLTGIDPEDVQRMDSIAHLDELQQIGRAVAARTIDLRHFDGFV
jgi:hypothetical protein